jgi:hypothetical protein
LHEKQLIQPEKFRSYSWISSVSASTEAAPSNAFFSNVMVFQFFFRGLPLNAITFKINLLRFIMQAQVKAFWND